MDNLYPLKAIRHYCLFCMNSNSNEIKICSNYDCSLWKLRFGRGSKGVSALKSIRVRCFACGEGTAFDIKNCKLAECCLFTYRFGKNPKLKGKGKGRPNCFAKRVVTTQETPKQAIVEGNTKEQLTVS